MVQRPERVFGLRRIRVDDLIPDKVLLLLGREVLDVLIDQHEFGQRGDVEAGPGLVERADDGRFRVGLDRKISLHFGQVSLESGVVFPEDIVVDDHDRGPVGLGQALELLGCHEGECRSGSSATSPGRASTTFPVRTASAQGRLESSLDSIDLGY